MSILDRGLGTWKFSKDVRKKHSINSGAPGFNILSRPLLDGSTENVFSPDLPKNRYCFLPMS